VLGFTKNQGRSQVRRIASKGEFRCDGKTTRARTVHNRTVIRTKFSQELKNAETKSLTTNSSLLNKQFDDDMKLLLQPIIGPPVKKEECIDVRNVDLKVTTQRSVPVLWKMKKPRI
jgi:hypothetical protein